MSYSYYPPVPHPTTPPPTCRPIYIANRAIQDRIVARRAIRSDAEQLQPRPRSRYCVDALEYYKPIVFDRGPKPIILGPHSPKPIILGPAL